jgi:outer membrane protein assembly factor BamB
LLIFTFACGLFGSSHQMGPTAQPVWEFASQGRADSYAAYALYADGIFYVLGAKLNALDEASGKVLWQAEADSYRLSEDQKLVYVSSGGKCTSLDAKSGKKKALSAKQAYLCKTDRADDSPYDFAVSEAGAIIAAEASTGKALWAAPLGLSFSSIFSQPPGAEPYIRRGQLIAHTLTFQEDHNVSYLNFQALDPSSGKLRWEMTGKPAGMAVISGDAVILAYQERFKAEPTTSAHPVPVPTGSFQLAVRDLATGKERWHVVTDYSDGYYVRGNLLYQCREANWRWFDMQTGKLVGEQKSVGTTYTYSCPSTDKPGFPTAELADDIWLLRGTRTSADNTNIETPIYDGWYTAFQISTGKALWSTKIIIHDKPYMAALGKSMVLLIEEDKLRAYRLKP